MIPKSGHTLFLGVILRLQIPPKEPKKGIARDDIMLVQLISMLSNFIHMVLGINSPQSFPPPLPPAKEQEYFQRMREGDMSMRNDLILHNLRLVSHIVRKYYASAKNQEDLVSIGTLGLIKAVDTFQLSNGAKFATYAARCIQNEILMHFRSQKKLSAEVSINETIDTDRDGNPLTYIDIIKCDDTIADDIDTRIKISRAAEYIMKNLNQREREIIILRYGLGSAPAKTQREVADKLGISRSYVSHRHYCKQVQPTGTGIPHRLYLFCCYDKSEHTFIFEIVIAFLRSPQEYILPSTCLHPP
jgi:RNA polymerase sporulation-specific sigma factor